MSEWLRRAIGRVSATVEALNAAPGQELATAQGFRVVVENTRPDILTAHVLARLDRALKLIAEVQPTRFRHLQADVARIRVASFPCRGAYLPADRSILTELSFLARESEFTDAIVASSILHEGVHARVARMRRHFGFGHSPADRAREERICRRAEAAFGAALPPALGAPVLARVASMQALTDEEVAPEIDWEAAFAVKAAADKAAGDQAALDRRRGQ
jgi:hypothetical protein